MIDELNIQVYETSTISDTITSIEPNTLLVIVCSSTGQGEVPKNARKFVSQCPNLDGVPFFMLGLGDSNYASFMGGPKSLFEKLTENGAKMIHPCVFADDNDKNDFGDKTDHFIARVLDLTS